MILYFDRFGNLPPGIHLLSLEEIRAEFGQTTLRRQWLMQQLEKIIKIAQRTRKLKQLFVWGSFVSSKPNPNDIDILLVFSSDFSDGDISLESLYILEHEQAKLRFQADIFWVREGMNPEVFNLLLETYQKDREQRLRGIVEVKL